ncbi:MAG: hypothetical protein HEEMFOPI_01263 [Holosporales bacterium]
MKKIIQYLFIYVFVQLSSMTNLLSSDAPLNVLCIDGGGVRGIIPAVILEEIEKRTGKSISKCFDVFCGTSTGGLISTACSLQGIYDVNPNAQINESSDSFSPHKLIDFYEKQSPEIFRSPWYRRYFSLFLSYKYSKEVICDKLNTQFGDKMLEDITKGKRLFLTMVDAQTNKLVVVDSNDPKYQRSLLKDLCLATSAAPTYFPSVPLKIGGERNIICGWRHDGQ